MKLFYDDISDDDGVTCCQCMSPIEDHEPGTLATCASCARCESPESESWLIPCCKCMSAIPSDERGALTIKGTLGTDRNFHAACACCEWCDSPVSTGNFVAVRGRFNIRQKLKCLRCYRRHGDLGAAVTKPKGEEGKAVVKKTPPLLAPKAVPKHPALFHDQDPVLKESPALSSLALAARDEENIVLAANIIIRNPGPRNEGKENRQQLVSRDLIKKRKHQPRPLDVLLEVEEEPNEAGAMGAATPS